MNPIVSGVGLLIMCWMAATSAQQTPAPTTEPAHKVYVLTGCLEGGAPASSFKLTGSSAVGQPPPASSSSAASKSSGQSSAYELQPISSVGEQGINRERLQSHVGKRVEVTVRPVDSLSPAGSSSTSTDTKAKPEEQPPQRYTVIKISRLADSCS
jgi:hypothetical protein